MRDEVVLFGPEVPDIGRLAVDAGLDVETVEAAVDELAHIVKTCTRLGYLFDLALTEEDLDRLDDEDWQRDRPHVFVGHPNAFDLNEANDYGHTVDLVDAAVGLHDRAGMSMEDAHRLVLAFAAQVAEIDERVEMSVRPRRLGFEKDIESEVEQDLAVLAFHGYNVVSADRQPRFGAAGRGDLLCELDDDSLLIIEFKRGSIVGEHLEQVQRYMNYLRETQPGRRVHGLLLGDGIDWIGSNSRWPIQDWPEDVAALAARHLDLPSGAAQRWVWWAERPTDMFTPDAVVAIAANGFTPVRVWPTPGRPSPGSTATDLDNWETVTGWSCPVPLLWDRDPASWSPIDIEAVVRLAISEEGDLAAP